MIPLYLGFQRLAHYLLLIPPFEQCHDESEPITIQIHRISHRLSFMNNDENTRKECNLAKPCCVLMCCSEARRFIQHCIVVALSPTHPLSIIDLHHKRKLVLIARYSATNTIPLSHKCEHWEAPGSAVF